MINVWLDRRIVRMILGGLRTGQIDPSDIVFEQDGVITVGTKILRVSPDVSIDLQRRIRNMYRP